MTAFIFLIAVVNLLLGYAAAVALVEPPVWAGVIDAWRRRRELKAQAAIIPVVEELARVEQPPLAAAITLADIPAIPSVVPGLEDLPHDWLTQLAAEGIAPQTFVEASAHVLRLEVGRYREQLVAAEIRARAAAEMRDAAGLKRLIDELRAVNQDWLDKQAAAADMLAQRTDLHGENEQAARALEQTLLDQAAQIRTACVALAGLDIPIEVATGCKKLLDLLIALLAQAHALRDGMLDLLAMLLKAGERLEGFALSVQRDANTGLHNRVGLEVILEGWNTGDEQHHRLLSAILIDIDRFGRLNQRLGTRAGDRTIAALGRLLDETLVKDRGFERLVRLHAESFLLLQGDVGPHQALTSAERLRQAIEATTFDDDGSEFDLTVSCGVIEIKSNESTLDFVKRAQDTLRFAKKAGRNRCALDKGDGATMLDPPQFPVKGRHIALRPPTPQLALPPSDSVPSSPASGPG